MILCFDVPAAEAAGEGGGRVFEIKALFLSADDNGVAVQHMPFARGTEGADVLNAEDPPVRPGDGPGLHITGPVKVG